MNKKITILLISLVLGIILYPTHQTNLLIPTTISITALAASKIPKRYTLIGAIAAIALGNYISQIKNNQVETITKYNDSKTSHKVVARISKQPDHRSNKSKYTVAIKTINNKEVKGKALIDLPRYPEYKYTEEIILEGKLKTPPEDENFSYKNYLSLFGVTSIIKNPKIIEARKTNKNLKEKIEARIFSLKNKFEKDLEILFPEPQSSLAAGLLLGSRKGLPKEINDDFQITGLTHIIAISGSNIAVVATITLALCRRLGTKISTVITILIITIFTVATGAQAAVTRAAIMGSVAVLAKASNKKIPAFTMVMLAVAIMLAHSPRMFWYDAGFQLSLAATLGVIYISPYTDKICDKYKIPSTLGIKEAVSLSTAAQISTTPIIILLFKKLSVISIAANTAVAPLLTPAMFLPLITWIVKELSLLKKICTYITYYTIEAIIKITHFFAKAPYAQIEIENLKPIYIYSYYIILTYIILKNKGLQNADPNTKKVNQ